MYLYNECITKEMGVVGDSLRLACQNHPAQAQIEARSANDFNQAPEGCQLVICGISTTHGRI